MMKHEEEVWACEEAEGRRGEVLVPLIKDCQICVPKRRPNERMW